MEGKAVSICQNRMIQVLGGEQVLALDGGGEFDSHQRRMTEETTQYG